MSDHPPFEHIYDLSDLSAGGAEIAIILNEPQRAKLAQWLEVERVEKFAATVTLRKLSMNRYRYEAELVCDLDQASVVSLVPVRAHVAESFSRELHVAHRLRRNMDKGSEEVSLASADDEAPEEIETSKYDLAGPLLEELSLALDPYPRAPDEVFSPPEVPSGPAESPFAVLKKLKDRG